MEKDQKETYFQEREQRNQSFSVLVDELRKNVHNTLSEIRYIVADGQLDNDQKISLINTRLNSENGKPHQVDKKIDEFKKNAVKLQRCNGYFALLESRSIKLQHRVSDIIRQVQFAPNCSKPALWSALQYYQENDGNVNKNAPVEFLSIE